MNISEVLGQALDGFEFEGDIMKDQDIMEDQDNPLGKVILKIVENKGKDINDSELYVKIEVGAYLPLYIERISPSEIAIAHFYTQNGDVMLDPEIVLGIIDGQLIPQTFEQSSLSTGQRPIKPNDEFIRIWAKNLKEQGFTGDKNAG